MVTNVPGLGGLFLPGEQTCAGGHRACPCGHLRTAEQGSACSPLESNGLGLRPVAARFCECNLVQAMVFLLALAKYDFE